eukprot:106017-Pelagomonas_calceolata.AAC.1
MMAMSLLTLSLFPLQGEFCSQYCGAQLPYLLIAILASMELYMNVAWLFEKQFEQEKKGKLCRKRKLPLHQLRKRGHIG